ncbi:nucleic-acid-binding protein from transposon X-element [Trichonephila clavata]|uniref:Nucleic-acid-binding protein from transposon X-element n=1 Tax=Trichonephila clavata TaxID=2740835 RepID=A0A8X6HCD7_TRICU|nr:nucleic-acid-binding protein from transposon X-element [Trichonephila clavata]
MVRYADSKVRFQQECIDIEMFDRRDTDPVHLESLIREKGTAELQIGIHLGELKSLFPCPVPNCSHNSTNGLNALKTSYRKRMAESCILPATFNPDKPETTQAKKHCLTAPLAETKKPNKKQPRNKSSKPISLPQVDITPVQNKFAALATIDDNPEPASSDQTIQDEPEITPKVKPIMLRMNEGYNLVLQDLNRKFPTATQKHTGEWFKIIAATSDDHRGITNLLTDLKQEYYSIPPLSERPLKVVIKGLPATTDINDISTDLINQGFPVIKVAQLTQRQSKFPLPIFMVEIRKHVPDAPDIFDLSKCCYLSVTVDSFRKRPGATQCYNCNYFHHSSVNCFLKTRCLKCSGEHRTGDCHIKEKIENPQCINCKETGHLANSRKCSAFPQQKPKKGATEQNPKKPVNFTSKIAETSLSYANASKNRQQGSAPDATSEPAIKKRPESGETSTSSNTFGFMTAITEFRKLFQELPGILAAGKALRNAATLEEKADIYFEAVVSGFA